jgi:hypothetical protein
VRAMRAVHCGIYWEGCLSPPVIALPSRGPPKPPTNVLVAEERLSRTVGA